MRHLLCRIIIPGSCMLQNVSFEDVELLSLYFTPSFVVLERVKSGLTIVNEQVYYVVMLRHIPYLFLGMNGSGRAYGLDRPVSFSAITRK